MKRKLNLAAVVLVVAAMIAATKYFSLQEQLGTLLRWIDTLGNWGPAAFLLIYIARCVLFIPGSEYNSRRVRFDDADAKPTSLSEKHLA